MQDSGALKTIGQNNWVWPGSFDPSASGAMDETSLFA